MSEVYLLVLTDLQYEFFPTEIKARRWSMFLKYGVMPFLIQGGVSLVQVSNSEIFQAFPTTASHHFFLPTYPMLPQNG